MKYYCAVLLFFFGFSASMNDAKAQSVYYPPLVGSTWDTLSPQSLGWCQDSLLSLHSFLAEKGTKAFIVLKNGKIVLESYFDNFTRDSNWYWASAGKTLTAFLVGMAQEQGIMHVDSPSARYLGEGWSSLTKTQENAVLVKHHLSMTTGLDYNVSDQNCKDPACLKYAFSPGTSWYYHNAPYLLLQDMVANAAGRTYQQFTTQSLAGKTGISGLWLDGVFFSRPRAMARFGLLVSQNGKWNGEQILRDSVYFQQMMNSSQNLNPSYGYLWWLNGKESFRIPSLTLSFPGSLFPDAPADMVAGLGKNDQKLYIVPSQDLVVVRMGNDAGGAVAGPSAFDNQLWKKINQLSCTHLSLTQPSYKAVEIFPNPSLGDIRISSVEGLKSIEVINNLGKVVSQLAPELNLSLSHLPTGFYYIKLNYPNEQSHFIKLQIQAK
jgi:CubicO group peptidase (beta-lactamase class C family)